MGHGRLCDWSPTSHLSRQESPGRSGAVTLARYGNASCSKAATSTARRSSLTQSPPPLLPHQPTDGSKRGYVIQQDDSAHPEFASITRCLVPMTGFNVIRLQHSTLQMTV
eukprot:5262246-Prymnesium_polylepis.1